LPPKIKQQLGETRISKEAIAFRLRQMFDEVVQEPLPEGFLESLGLAEDCPPPSRTDTESK
jgi:hypothetical protein